MDYRNLLKNRWVKKPWVSSLIKGSCAFLITFTLISQTSQYVGLVYNRTQSLPYHLFLHLKRQEPKKEQYTCFESPWYGKPVIKKVAGVEGDDLSYDKEGNLWIGRILNIGKPKKKARDERMLTPLKPQTIPKGMVFVMGHHERSFDSRYAEMGLIPVKNLQGRLIALI